MIYLTIVSNANNSSSGSMQQCCIHNIKCYQLQLKYTLGNFRAGSKSMRLIKVYLNVYDFLSINGCLAAVGLGGYHTAIEIKYSF